MSKLVLEKPNSVKISVLLTSIVKHGLRDSKYTFATCIDMAFYSVNRELLFDKLLHYNIEGKVYFAIKALHSHMVNCIKLNNNFTG